MAATFDDARTETVKIGGDDFAYRVIGDGGDRPVDGGDRPVVFLQHFTGVLDDWDPALIDGVAQRHPVIIFDNRGVGRSQGRTPDSVEAMAEDTVAFLGALGLKQVDLVGFSLGGFIAQLIAHDRPDLVRRVILAGTGPAGGKGISNLSAVLQDAFGKAAEQKKHPKHFLFFSQTQAGQAAADAFLARLQIRKNDRDPAASNETTQAQATAIIQWGQGGGGANRPLGAIKQPVLVANGDNDIMVPTANSFALFEALPDAELSIFPDAGHGGLFQYHREFVEQALRFFAN
jgi:pimeloyl-ACP methyl ester carboxylesterase